MVGKLYFDDVETSQWSSLSLSLSSLDQNFDNAFPINILGCNIHREIRRYNRSLLHYPCPMKQRFDGIRAEKIQIYCFVCKKKKKILKTSHFHGYIFFQYENLF